MALRLLLVCLVSLLGCTMTACAAGFTSSSGNRHSIIQRTCLNRSMSEWSLPRPTASISQCLVLSRFEKLSGVGVVQLDTRDATCSLFLFSRVCHLLNLSSPASAPSVESNSCEIVVDSELDALTANRHFAAVWLGGKGPQLENLVCGDQGQKNVIEHTGVTWTDEGALMDGLTSRMWVTDTSGFKFNSGFTWLMELKRTLKVNVFIEATDCSSFTHAWLHMWEWDESVPVDTCRLYIQTGHRNLFSAHKILSNQSDEFVRVGATFDISMIMNRTRIFVERDFIPEDAVTLYMQNNYEIHDFCLKIGWRDSNNPSTMLNGTVKVLAVSNNYLPADAIVRLFNV